MQSIDEFVHGQNVVNLKRRLNTELDQGIRKMLLTLLAEEQAKLGNSTKYGGGSIRIALQSQRLGTWSRSRRVTSKH